MLMYGLTDRSAVVKLKVIKVIKNDTEKKVIVKGLVLDKEKDLFTKNYSPLEDGDLMYQTITEDPKEIFTKLSSVRSRIEAEETSFMKNLFLMNQDNSEFISNELPEHLKNKDADDDLDYDDEGDNNE